MEDEKNILPDLLNKPESWMHKIHVVVGSILFLLILVGITVVYGTQLWIWEPYPINYAILFSISSIALSVIWIRRETMSNLINAGYKILLLDGIFLFTIVLFFHLFESSLNTVIISILAIILPLFFISYKKVVLGDHLVKTLPFLLGYSALLIPFLSLCSGPLYAILNFIGGYTFHSYYARTDLVTFLTCPASSALWIGTIIFFFLVFCLLLNIFQLVVHTYHYVRIWKMKTLFAFGISLFLGAALIAVLVRLFELAGNLLWR